MDPTIVILIITTASNLILSIVTRLRKSTCWTGKDGRGIEVTMKSDSLTSIPSINKTGNEAV